MLYTDPSGLCVFAIVDTLICVGGLTLTIGQAIAIVAATGVATYATYDACVTQGRCGRLANDVENALQQRQTATSNFDVSPRDDTGLPLLPELGSSCVVNSLTGDDALAKTRTAIQTAAESLVRSEGLSRDQVTILYRGTTVAEAQQPRSMLWTTPHLSDATIYATFGARQTSGTAAIALYSIPTVLLRGFISAGQVKLRNGQPVVRFNSRELGFPTHLQRFLLGPIVIPIPLNFTGS